MPSDLVIGRRVAMLSVAASVLLAASNITVGLLADSTSVVATGFEFAGDVLASTIVLIGLLLAARPADENHPYGHGRLETLAGFTVGMILVVAGIGISVRSLQALGVAHHPPAGFAIWALVGAITVRSGMSTVKFRVGRRIGSGSLVADAWNDAVDILSACAALVAVALARYDPSRFLAADSLGGCAVGLVVVITGLRVMRDTALDLTDAMPDPPLMDLVRQTALAVPGVVGVEKQMGRKTGLQYRFDLHLEVDPELTVRQSHAIAGEVRSKIRALAGVADVLVHVEPAPDQEEGT
jgi:cation diffusion facilitator family transporter